WGAQPPTGIQRVELTICKAALDRGDIGFLALDSLVGRYLPLTNRQMAFLRYIVAGNWAPASDSYWDRVRAAFRYLSVPFTFQDKETARSLRPALACSNQHHGAIYQTSKLFVRLCQWAYMAVRVPLLVYGCFF